MDAILRPPLHVNRKFASLPSLQNFIGTITSKNGLLMQEDYMLPVGSLQVGYQH